jgi:hypothetical protein
VHYQFFISDGFRIQSEFIIEDDNFADALGRAQQRLNEGQKLLVGGAQWPWTGSTGSNAF